MFSRCSLHVSKVMKSSASGRSTSSPCGKPAFDRVWVRYKDPPYSVPVRSVSGTSCRMETPREDPWRVTDYISLVAWECLGITFMSVESVAGGLGVVWNDLVWEFEMIAASRAPDHGVWFDVMVEGWRFSGGWECFWDPAPRTSPSWKRVWIIVCSPAKSFKRFWEPHIRAEVYLRAWITFTNAAETQVTLIFLFSPLHQIRYHVTLIDVQSVMAVWNVISAHA